MTSYDDATPPATPIARRRHLAASMAQRLDRTASGHFKKAPPTPDRTDALRQLGDGASVTEVAAAFAVSPSTVYRWRAEATRPSQPRRTRCRPRAAVSAAPAVCAWPGCVERGVLMLPAVNARLCRDHFGPALRTWR